jgi:hypothetical protein
MTHPSSPASGGNRAGRQLAPNRNKAAALRVLQQQAQQPRPYHWPSDPIWDIPAPPAWEDLHLDQQDAIRERFKLAALAMAVRQVADQRCQSPEALLADWEVG